MSITWDGFDAYLFDIDGTLLLCTDAVHYFAFCDTLTAIIGRPANLDGVATHGNVDNGILRDAFTRAGIPEEQWRPRLAEAQRMLCEQVERNRGDLRTNPTPQVKEFLQHLKDRGAKLGVATGNLRTIGRLKLQNCGLLDYFDFGGWSDAFESRQDVFAHALEQAKALTAPEASVCVVGDTPADIQAAKANDLPVIAVATGIHPFEQLQQEQPTWCIQSFADLLPQEQDR